jgi:DNA polymerase I-like protein with 3'-5' exonuclease and polymerase domains
MDDIKIAQAATTVDDTPKKAGRKKSETIHVGDLATGDIFKKKSAYEKRWLDMFGYLNPVEVVGNKKVVFVNTADPLEGRPLCPGKTSPLCTQCGMDMMGGVNPYIEPYGAEDPLITVIAEKIVQSQDDYGKQIVPTNDRVRGSNTIYRLLAKHMDTTGVDPDRDVRWLTITRCAVRGAKVPNLSTKAQWCRYHTVQDLRLHPPKLIMPFGTVPLGALSHKSNATTWQGKTLTYRGWPDDWLTEPKFMLPRLSMHGDGSMVTGHPLFGELKTSRTLLYPLQSPNYVWATQNPRIKQQWEDDILRGLELAKSGAEPLDYVLPHYNVTTDQDEVVRWMHHLSHVIPGTTVSFDTETNGLKAYAKGAKIVFMMFRWDDPATGEPQSIGFPWDFPTSELAPYVGKLTPWILEALYASDLAGHNISFDALFVAATLKGCDINRLAPKCKYDTWHMAYTSKQSRDRLGLERITYDYAPHMAGYEEDMTLLIQLHSELLDPGADAGGHYAMCPKDKWDTHLVPYVMGDVETVHCARPKLQEKLDTRKVYPIPLADPKDHGRFRTYTPPSRSWLYSNIISPASRMLTKMMARGMFIDDKTLKEFEFSYPRALVNLKSDIGTKHPQIAAWIAQREAETREAEDNKEWEFDLDNKEVLKDLLFNWLKLPVQRVTKAGREFFPEPEDIAAASFADQLKYAAVDKFTLNKLAADHAIARPLLEYRKLFKLYTTYIRPLRNHFDPDVDKKRRDKIPHLWLADEGGDSCLHASFMLTGTRGGRLSCRDPNLQQLPSDSDIKKMFVSRFGGRGCVYAGDLSQIELRLLAAACGDPNMLKAYYDDLDLHTLTTSRIFKMPYETFTKQHMEELQKGGKSDEASQRELQRKIGKTCNFLTGYGGGAFGLQTTLANSRIYLPIEECEDILESFFESYPTLRQYLGQYKEFILESGVAVSLLGRVRIFEEVDSDDNEQRSKALRAGCNHLIQATASDMMLVCLCVIEDAMREQNLESILVSTVHDSLVVDAVKEELPVIHEIVYTVVNNIPNILKMVFGDTFDTSWMIVPFAGDCEVGMNYKKMKKIPTKGEPDWEKLLCS